ncbi:MAG: hypothetical protein WC046_07875 [Candidatus Bathyarchaeia archaeon]
MSKKLTITKTEWDRICKGKTCSFEYGLDGGSTKCPIAHSCTKRIRSNPDFPKKSACNSSNETVTQQ